MLTNRTRAVNNFFFFYISINFITKARLASNSNKYWMKRQLDDTIHPGRVSWKAVKPKGGITPPEGHR